MDVFNKVASKLKPEIGLHTRARINRWPLTAMAVDALVIGHNALKNIGLLTAKKRVPYFPFGRDALAVLCVPFLRGCNL